MTTRADLTEAVVQCARVELARAIARYGVVPLDVEPLRAALAALDAHDAATKPRPGETHWRVWYAGTESGFKAVVCREDGTFLRDFDTPFRVTQGAAERDGEESGLQRWETRPADRRLTPEDWRDIANGRDEEP